MGLPIKFIVIVFLKETIALYFASFFIKINFLNKECKWDCFFLENLALSFKVDNIIWNQPQNVNKPMHSGCSQISMINSSKMKFVKAKILF